MTTKSSQTSLYILEKVAPIFNKQGYMGTSMKSITDAVGLTKGAIYGNFKNKEELAVKAFDFNVRKIIVQVAARTEVKNSPLEKLAAITDFYRHYRDFTETSGGCPVLNIGVDANNQNERLLKRVHEVIRKLENSMADIIQGGIDCGEIKKDVEPKRYSKRLFAMIQGAVFMTFTLNDKSYIMDMMDHIDNMINLELRLSSK
jgi:TetR/AcrR family transcriptional repressor of nem operon